VGGGRVGKCEGEESVERDVAERGISPPPTLTYTTSHSLSHLHLPPVPPPSRPHLPADIDFLPTQMVPFIKVPVVSTQARHLKVMPKKVVTPVTSSLGPTCEMHAATPKGKHAFRSTTNSSHANASPLASSTLPPHASFQYTRTPFHTHAHPPTLASSGASPPHPRPCPP
jgi:hypothetical protein